MPRRSLLILYALALVVALIAARVEWLNAAAGFYLPRDSPADVGKWRDLSMSETRWLRYHGPRDAAGSPVTRPLTADERRQMTDELARANANGRLRSWVMSAGVLQYLLLPTLAIATLAAIARRPTRQRVLALAPVLLVVAFAAWSLWHRGYFSSLERPM